MLKQTLLRCKQIAVKNVCHENNELIRTIDVQSDRLRVAQDNLHIGAADSYYGPAMELGINVTHRENAPDSGIFSPVEDW